jgi:hypothetical protein
MVHVQVGEQLIGKQPVPLGVQPWIDLWDAQSRTWPVSCQFVSIAARYGGGPTPYSRGHLVLPKLAYLALCRSIQLLVLLARGDAAKDLEILVPRHQLTVMRPPGRTSQAGACRSSATRRGQPRPSSSPRVVLLHQTGDAAALAATPGRRHLDPSAPPDRPATAGPGGAAADRPPGEGELALGVGCESAFTQLAGDDGAGWGLSADGCRAHPLIPLSRPWTGVWLVVGRGASSV